MDNQINQFLSLKLIDDINISMLYVIMALVSSTICAYLIKLTYIKFGRALNNRDNFSNIFVLLCITTSIIIVIVKYSLALSLGLVGALSIVRFRAAIKEPEELVYLFLVIAIGLAFGANQFVIGYLLTFFSIIIISLTRYFGHSDSKTSAELNMGTLLIIEGPKDEYNKWYSEDFHKIKELSEKVILKDLLNNSENITRATFQLSRGKNISDGEDMLKELNNISKLSVELISDIVVPD